MGPVHGSRSCSKKKSVEEAGLKLGLLIFLLGVSYSRMIHVRNWKLDDDSGIGEHPSEDFIWLCLLENLSWPGNFSFQKNVPLSFCLFVYSHYRHIQGCH